MTERRDVPYGLRGMLTIRGCRDRGPCLGLFVTSVWPADGRNVVMYLGEVEHESFRRPWVTKDRAKLFETDEAAYTAANGAEQFTSYPVDVQRVYKNASRGLVQS